MAEFLNYNADVTTSAPGSFRMVVKDAEGNVVLDKSLNGSSGPDSFSGVTSSGIPGSWPVSIIWLLLKETEASL